MKRMGRCGIVLLTIMVAEAATGRTRIDVYSSHSLNSTPAIAIQEQACSVPSFFASRSSRPMYFWSRVHPIVDAFLRPLSGGLPSFELKFSAAGTAMGWDHGSTDVDFEPDVVARPVSAPAAPVPDLTVRPVGGSGEMDKVFEITYDNYLEQGYINPSGRSILHAGRKSQLNHYRLHNWSNRTQVLVAIKPGTGEVIGSISWTLDRKTGWAGDLLDWMGFKSFPFEHDFPKELREARASGERLAGIWRLVVRQDYQSKPTVLNALYYAALDAMEAQGVESFLLVCNGPDLDPEPPQGLSHPARFRRFVRELWSHWGLSEKPSRIATEDTPNRNHARAYQVAYNMIILASRSGAHGLGTNVKPMKSSLMQGDSRERTGDPENDKKKFSKSMRGKWKKGQENRLHLWPSWHINRGVWRSALTQAG